MCRSCLDCGVEIQRRPPERRWPLRCSSCRKNSARTKQHEECLARWSCLSCKDCGKPIAATPKRGPLPGRCVQCTLVVRRKQSAMRRLSRDTLIHRHHCQHCNQPFRSARPRQKFCSSQCGHLASRSRSQIACQRCGSQFEIDASRAEKRRFCSWDCWTAIRPSHEKTCVGCGQSFTRSINGKMPHQDKGKYCSRECYLDHRWGSSRPRKRASKSGLDSACRRSLATSLRKRCKQFSVPFDPACTREAVCERDGWVCQQCGVKCHKGRHRFNRRTRRTSLRSAEHDHIVPLSWSVPDKGNTFDNSQCLCRKCNGKKGRRGGGQMLIAAFATP
jgi:hypothetical protein